MTMDRTLKTGGGLVKTRNVLTRAERIGLMLENGNFDPKSDSPLGLRKLRTKQHPIQPKVDMEQLEKDLEEKVQQGSEE